MKINFYYINEDYLDLLRQSEIKSRGFTCVPNTQYHSGRTKFFYGAVLEVNSIKYFVPVSSKAHFKQDDMLIKIKDKKNPIAGTLRFRYMLPVPNSCIKLLIRDELNQLMKLNNPTERSIEVMLWGMKSQLFGDGNKRNSMLAANKIMIENGCGIISVPNKYLEQFNEVLSDFYTNNSLDYAKNFVYEHCIDGIDFKEREACDEDEDYEPEM